MPTPYQFEEEKSLMALREKVSVTYSEEEIDAAYALIDEEDEEEWDLAKSVQSRASLARILQTLDQDYLGINRRQ